MSTFNESKCRIPNILIVDDLTDNLRVLGEILKTEGYKVRPVTNGPMAMHAAEFEKPDLILLDIMMPEMNGYQVCTELKKRQDLCNIPVIFISALNETNDVVKALSSGGVDYITKPFQIEEVKARVATHLKLHRQNRELQELIAEKEKFFSIIAHDLKGPFSGFLGMTEIMDEKLGNMDYENLNEFSQHMKNSAGNLYKLLENLLEWSGMQRGVTEYKPGYFKLMPELIDSRMLISDSLIQKNIGLSIDIAEDVSCYADVNMFRSIIRNLLSNALKFTPKGGNITLIVRVLDDSMLEISVKDTGIGMDESMVQNLFRSSFNSRREGTDGELSTGLGLLICKEFIIKNKGRIKVESKEGIGSVFYFTIPVKENAPLHEKCSSAQ